MFRFQISHASQPWRGQESISALSKWERRGCVGVWSLELAGRAGGERTKAANQCTSSPRLFPHTPGPSLTLQPTGTGTGRGRHGASSAGYLNPLLPRVLFYYFTISLFHYFTSNDQGTWGTRDDHEVQLAQESIIPRSHRISIIHHPPSLRNAHTLSQPFDSDCSATSPSHSCITRHSTSPLSNELYHCCSSHLTGLRLLLLRVLVLSILIVLAAEKGLLIREPPYDKPCRSTNLTRRLIDPFGPRSGTGQGFPKIF